MFELVKKEYRLIRGWLLLALGIMAALFLAGVLLINPDAEISSGTDGKFGFILAMQYRGGLLLPCVGPIILGAWSLTKDNMKLLLTNNKHLLLQLGLKIMFAIGSTAMFILLYKLLFLYDGSFLSSYASIPQYNNIINTTFSISAIYTMFNFSFLIGIGVLMVKRLKQLIGGHSWWVTFVTLYLFNYAIFELDSTLYNVLTSEVWFSYSSLAYTLYYGFFFIIACCTAEKRLEL